MRVKSFLLMLLLPGALVASAALSENREKTLEVRYYDPRLFTGADMPFQVAPPDTLPESAVTAEWIRQKVIQKDVIVEVCVLVQDARTREWRGPRGLEERKHHCFAYG